MSECIICKGKKPTDIGDKFMICETDSFESMVAKYIWDEVDIWTVKVNGYSIDFYLTKAQEEINQGESYKSTEFYKIISKLISSNVKLAMWYDIYYENLPVYNTLDEILSACYKGITDSSGMCEVYFQMR